MRTFAVMSVLAGFGLLLQTTFFHSLRLGPAVPDLLLILCVYLALYRPTVGGAIGVFVLGYLEDSASGGATGLNSFGMCLVFLLVHLTSRHLWVDNILSRVVVVFLASVVKAGGVMVLLALFASLEGVWGALIHSAFLQAILTTIVAAPVLTILARIQPSRDMETG